MARVTRPPLLRTTAPLAAALRAVAVRAAASLAVGLLALAATSAALPCSAGAAAQSVHLAVSLTPEHLGRGTTIGIGFQIDGPASSIPSPVRAIHLRYPENLGIALSGLGIETCTAATLEALGPSGCPPDSVMGRGSALGEIPFGPEIVREGATVTIVRAEDENGHIALLFDVQGISPVAANLVFPGVLLPARPPFGGELSISVPLVPSLPEAPDVAVVRLQATIGPDGLTYFEDIHGAITPYVPRGVLLPDSCPRGGFPFDSTLVFQNGTRSRVRARVPCRRGRR
jgi:hypothetical protein